MTAHKRWRICEPGAGRKARLFVLSLLIKRFSRSDDLVFSAAGSRSSSEVHSLFNGLCYLLRIDFVHFCIRLGPWWFLCLCFSDGETVECSTGMKPSTAAAQQVPLNKRRTYLKISGLFKCCGVILSDQVWLNVFFSQFGIYLNSPPVTHQWKVKKKYNSKGNENPLKTW